METNDTDRELLEFAAKAGGNKIVGWLHGPVHVAILSDGTFWQPLHLNRATDCMGDALRLAVKLNICLMFVSYPTGLNGFPAGDFVKAISGSIILEQLGAGDDAAATRRAIVYAAAEIGKQLPN